MTDVQTKKMLENEFGSGSPTAYYIGISLSDPLSTGLGIVEPSLFYGYSRVEILNNKDNWTNYVNGSISNKNIIQFSQIIDNNWNTLEQPFFWFLATSKDGIGDDIKFYKEVTENKPLLEIGKLIRIPVGAFKITVG